MKSSIETVVIELVSVVSVIKKRECAQLTNRAAQGIIRGCGLPTNGFKGTTSHLNMEVYAVQQETNAAQVATSNWRSDFNALEVTSSLVQTNFRDW